MKRRSRYKSGLLTALAVCLAAVLIAMLDLSARFLFPTHMVARAGPMPPGAKKIEFAGPSGNRLVGIHLPPGKPNPEGVLILGFGGNGWNAQDVAEYLHEIFPDADVVSFYYRGYAPSGGDPSSAAFLRDAPAVHDLVVERLKPAKVVAVGFSIGSGVAAALSVDRELDGVILVTPFESLRAVAQDTVPWVPLGPLFRHDIESADALARSGVRTAIFAGARDDIVRPKRTDRLRERAPNVVFDLTIPNAGHNNIYAKSDFQLGLRDALTRLIS